MHHTGLWKLWKYELKFEKQHFVDAYRKHWALPVKHTASFLLSFPLCFSGLFPTHSYHMGLMDSDIIIKWHVSNRQPKRLLWRSNPGLIISASALLTLSLSLPGISGRTVAARKLAQGNSQCQSHTHRMSNTHSSPWCGGTLINSIPDSCLVFEKASQWVVAAIGGKS